MKASRNIADLIAIMAALRTPGSGCPWDLQQSFETIAPYTIEEAYEVADAIARNDLHDLRDELGDLLLQVVFHARIAEESQNFDFGDVVKSICDKLLRRHPHVFNHAEALSIDGVNFQWERIKAEEKAARANARTSSNTPSSAHTLSEVRAGLPALNRALKLQNAASKVGFDWNDPKAVLAKIREEADEIETAMAGGTRSEIEAEIGDLLFAVVNLARHLKADPETALRTTNAKFERRFAAIEQALAVQGKTPPQATLSEMDALWNVAKHAERNHQDKD